MKQELAGCRLVQADALDLGHPAILADVRPDFRRHVHKARHHIGLVQGRPDGRIGEQRRALLHRANWDLELQLGLRAGPLGTLVGSCAVHTRGLGLRL